MNQPNPNETLYISKSWKNGVDTNPAFCFAEDIILYLMLLPLLLDLTDLLQGPPLSWAAVALLLPEFAVLTVFRLRAKRKVVFALCVLSITAAAFTLFFWMKNLPSALVAAAAGGICTHKLNARRVRQEAALEHTELSGKTYLGFAPIAAGFFFSLCAYADALRRGAESIMAVSVGGFAVLCVSMLIYTHLYGEYCFSLWEKRNSVMEVEKKKDGKVSFTLAACFCCVITVIVGLILAVLSGASRMDEAILNFFGSYRGPEPIGRQPTNLAGGMNTSQFSGFLNQIEKNSAYSPGSQFLSMALKVFFSCVIVGVMIYVTVRFIRWVFLHFGDKVEEERHSILEEAAPLKNIKKELSRPVNSFLLSLRGSNRMKIRKMFLYFVRKRDHSSQVRQSDTPVDIMKKIGEAASEPDTAVSLYEKARYGNKDLSADDVAQMHRSL